MSSSTSREYRLNVQKSTQNVVQDEFGNMRDHFDAEMKRIDEEMQRLRHEFASQHQQNVQALQPGPGSALSQPMSPPSSFPSQQQALIPKLDSHMQPFQSSLIREESDGKTLRLRFDVSGYAPEEVTVKTVDNRLVVQALHEEKGPGKSVHREFNQDFTLPHGTNPETITSSLSVDGVLTVQAPIPQLAITN